MAHPARPTAYANCCNGSPSVYEQTTMPDGRAVVLASSNARPGVPSANSRFPVPTRTGLMGSTSSSTSPCSISAESSVELPQHEVRAIQRLDTAHARDEIRPDDLDGTPLEALRPMGDDVLRCR